MAVKSIGTAHRTPGIKIAKVAIGRRGLMGTFNPLMFYWVVNPHRKERCARKAIEDLYRKPKLPAYSQSLFDHMFKNWGNKS